MTDERDEITRYIMVNDFKEFLEFCDWMYECEMTRNGKVGFYTPSFEDYMNEKFNWLSDVFRNRTIH